MKQIPIKIIPFGGLGEIGKNLLAIEYKNEILIIDAGIEFPSNDMFGVDLIIPDINYLIENSFKIRGILITHGHEDHIGALPYIIPKLNVPIYSSRFSNALISGKLREHGLLKTTKLNVISPGKLLRIGNFEIEFFNVCHSIPDAMGISINTPIGQIIHTGDFKFDHTPEYGARSDFKELSRIAEKKTLLLMSDSTYAEVEGYNDSEKNLSISLNRYINEAKGRIIVATFASLIPRIQTIINIAKEYKKKITIVRRSMNNNIKMSIKMGYLDIPKDMIISSKESMKLKPNEIIILATGAQGEPTSALSRISQGNHNDIKIIPGDTVILSSSPIPGNEVPVSETINNLSRLEANVLHSKTANVHVHGHASKEELKTMLSLIQPRFFIPVHGEYRHLVHHAKIAESMGVLKSNIFILEDGDILELNSEFGKKTGSIELNRILVSSKKSWAEDPFILRQRKDLAHNGIIALSINIDKRNRRLINNPEIDYIGFKKEEISKELIIKITKKTKVILENLEPNNLKLNEIKENIEKGIKAEIKKESHLNPSILVLLSQIP